MTELRGIAKQTVPTPKSKGPSAGGSMSASEMLRAFDLRRATEAAARAAFAWQGRGDKSQGDAAAISALTHELIA